MTDQAKKRLCPECDKETDAAEKSCQHCGLRLDAVDEIGRVLRAIAKQEKGEKKPKSGFFDAFLGGK